MLKLYAVRKTISLFACLSDLEEVVGGGLAHRIASYSESWDKPLTELFRVGD